MHHSYSLILELAARKSRRSRSSVTEAIDDLAFFDPETELGKELTNAMVKVNQAGLLDQYIGYERAQNKVLLHFEQETQKSKIDALTQALADGLQAKDGFAEPVLGVKYYKMPDDDQPDEYTWVIEFTCSAPVEDEEGEFTPTAVNLQGEVATEEGSTGETNED